MIDRVKMQGPLQLRVGELPLADLADPAPLAELADLDSH